jgi:hypothetical protein
MAQLGDLPATCPACDREFMIPMTATRSKLAEAGKVSFDVALDDTAVDAFVAHLESHGGGDGGTPLPVAV